MNHRLLLILCWLSCDFGVSADESWQTVLSKMPLPANSPPLNRDNGMSLLLGAFQSNDVVKALIFLPGVSDDFFLINRDKPKLNIAASNLFQTITALTNATEVRATFRKPFLLLHTARDHLEPHSSIEHSKTAEKLQQQRHWPHLVLNDTHWERLQPALKKNLRIKVLPDAESADAWHFNRHSFAGWNLTDWELITALSLTGKTSFTVQKDRITFQVDSRPATSP